MPVFFNNCHAREHTFLFRSDAFYDLGFTGKQAEMATGLKRGEECVVIGGPHCLDQKPQFLNY